MCGRCRALQLHDPLLVLQARGSRLVSRISGFIVAINFNLIIRHLTNSTFGLGSDCGFGVCGLGSAASMCSFASTIAWPLFFSQPTRIAINNSATTGLGPLDFFIPYPSFGSCFLLMAAPRQNYNSIVDTCDKRRCGCHLVLQNPKDRSDRCSTLTSDV